MHVLSKQEVEQVSGGGKGSGTAVGATLGLMALAAGSPVVIGVGCLALIAHFTIQAVKDK